MGNTQLTRREVLGALDANITFAKDCAADLLRHMGRPSTAEQEHVVHEVQRIQGYLGGVLMPLVRALQDDESD